MVSKYNEYVAGIGKSPSLEILGEFLDREASLASFAVTVSMFGNTNRDSNKTDTNHSNKRHDNRGNNHSSNRRVFLVGESSSSKPRNSSCYYCSDKDHLIRNCKQFLKLSIDDRWRWTKTRDARRCYRRLGEFLEHHARDCKAPSCKRLVESGKPCGSPHHILLHFNKEKSSNYPTSSVNTTQGNAKST